MLELRPFQAQALRALSAPGHVVCVAPTGAGKSLIYERAAMKPGRRTLLVTPLVALARQQRERASLLPSLNVALGAGAPSEPPPPGETGIWIVSPEKLRFEPSLRKLRAWRPDFLVVDECHCLWEWGDGFRPDFRRLPELVRSEGIDSSLWLTATLPLDAREELRSLLPKPLHELGSFDLPPRLALSVARVPWVERAEVLLGWLIRQSEPGLVFAPTRETAERLGRLVRATGREALVYHAGMGSEERRSIEARIAARAPDAVIATSAFGMGMDYPGLRWVALWQAPPSLLALAQAIGRVGRDPSRNSRAIALWDADDFRTLEWMAKTPKQRRQLELVSRFTKSRRCRREALRDYFERGLIDLPGEGPEPETGRCGLCDSCAAKRERPSVE